MRNNWCVYFLLLIFHSKPLKHRQSVWTVLVLCGWSCIQGSTVWAQLETTEQVQAIELELQTLHTAVLASPNEPRILTNLSRLYLKKGGISQDSNEHRISIHEKGSRLAKQALALQENLADAHFYYAANLGSATQLKGVMASAFVVQELKFHVNRAIELQHDHAPALHMLGRMLDELPWFLGGDQEAALHYLEKAVSVDENDTHARLDLAKLYLKRKNVPAATKELQKIVQHIPMKRNWSWRYQYKPEAEKMLRELKN